MSPGIKGVVLIYITEFVGTTDGLLISRLSGWQGNIEGFCFKSWIRVSELQGLLQGIKLEFYCIFIVWEF